MKLVLLLKGSDLCSCLTLAFLVTLRHHLVNQMQKERNCCLTAQAQTGAFLGKKLIYFFFRRLAVNLFADFVQSGWLKYFIGIVFSFLIQVKLSASQPLLKKELRKLLLFNAHVFEEFF